MIKAPLWMSVAQRGGVIYWGYEVIEVESSLIQTHSKISEISSVFTSKRQVASMLGVSLLYKLPC